MDTTQKNREAARKPRSQDGKKPAAQQPRKNSQGTKKREEPRRTNSASASRSTQQKSSAAKASQQRPRQAAPQKTAARTDVMPDSVSTKKRAYGNSKPKKKSALASVFQNTRKKTAAKSSTAGKKAAVQSQKAPQSKPVPTPAVIYTQPQPFNRNRLLIQLVTVTAVVLAFVMGLSVFFKVETITITGADVYSAWAVREASGIEEGDNLLTFSKIRAASQIKANLPYVKSVRIGIKLPDTVNIMIVEEEVVYAIKSSDGTWWLMTSAGRVIEQSNGAAAAGYTQVLGVTLDNPTPNEKGVATENVTAETDASGELAPVTVTGSQRLNAALQILKALENNDIVGDAASVDVSRTEDIILWYGTRYQVNLGDTSNLDYKIACMNDVILQMSDYQSGILDISFTTWTDKVGYTPFE